MGVRVPEEVHAVWTKSAWRGTFTDWLAARIAECNKG